MTWSQSSLDSEGMFKRIRTRLQLESKSADAKPVYEQTFTEAVHPMYCRSIVVEEAKVEITDKWMVVRRERIPFYCALLQKFCTCCKCRNEVMISQVLNEKIVSVKPQVEVGDGVFFRSERIIVRVNTAGFGLPKYPRGFQMTQVSWTSARDSGSSKKLHDLCAELGSMYPFQSGKHWAMTAR